MDSPIKLRNDFEYNGRESVDSGTGDLENDIVEENNNESYIYLKKLKEWEKMGNVKYGHTSCKKNSPEKRLKDSHEEHINVPQYVTLFKIIVKKGEYKLGYQEKDKIFTHIVSKLNYIKGLENKFGIELPNMKEFNRKNYLKINNPGGTEFMSNSQECIELFRKVIIVDFPKIGLTTEELDKEEVEKINRMEIEKNEEERKRKEEVERKRLADLLGLSPTKQKNKYQKREYQIRAIKECIDRLEKRNKVYLELATGGGKSYIVYKIFGHFLPDNIVIFSPRKKINEQNCSKKYLSILNNKYKVFNCSERNDFDEFIKECCQQNKKMIIVACPQKSHEKVYNIIHDYNLNNISIWFDEAHHTIEKWVYKLEDRYVDFFLQNTEKIKNRILTSASPNKKWVEQQIQIFGELYSPIKVKELISLKWLCPIIPHIFSLNKSNVDICNYNLDHFNKYKCKFGFSFHNIRESAFNLFQEHYKKFISGNTKILPFLLVGDDYKNYKLNEIKLKYEYRSIKKYEKTPNSIGYVVQQYSIGYDFNKIDYIMFSDPKMSYYSMYW